MKINFVLTGVSPSGGVLMVFRYADFLKKQGHDVCIYYALKGGYVGIKRILFPKLILYWLIDENRRGKWYSGEVQIKHPFSINNFTIRDADYTFATSYVTAYWVQKLHKRKGKKIYFIQGYETWDKKAKAKEWVTNTYNIPFDKYIAISGYLSRELNQKHGINSEIIRNGLPKAETRDIPRLPTNSQTIVIGMPYRDGTNKNCILGMKVIREISYLYNVRIVAYGFEKPIQWLDDFDFYLSPSREELYDIYDQINIFYVPSVYEGWGLPAMEAMGHGCAVVAANTGIINDIGVDGINCVKIINPLDAEEAIIKISELIDNPNKAWEIGENARKMIVSQYTQEESCKKLEALLEDLK